MTTAGNRWLERVVAMLVIVAAVVLWFVWDRSGLTSSEVPAVGAGSRPAPQEATTAESLPAAAAPRTRVDGSRTVTGRLVWNDGVPVVGANVRCDLAADADHTDADGRFELRAPAEDLRVAQSVIITAHPPCWLPSEPAFSQRVECGRNSPVPGGRLELGDLAIPAVVDVEVVFEFERAATQLATRAGYGIVHVRIGDPSPALSGMLAGAVTSLKVDLTDAPPVRVLRVPIRNLVHVAASLEPSTRWAVVADHIATTAVDLSRCRPARTVVPLRSANLLTGRVVDHEGHPLRLATLKLEQVAAAEGGRLRVTRSFDDGTFLILGTPGETFAAVATFETAKSPVYQLVVGNRDYELRCPTESLRRVRVRSGLVPVTRYEFAEHSVLFGQRVSETPKLGEHVDGLGFLSSRDLDLCRYLCWQDGDGFREATVRIPPSPRDALVQLDVATLDVEPRGVLTIHYGASPSKLTVRRVMPAPEEGFQGFVAGAVSTDPRPLTGIPAGTYAVEVRAAGSNPFQPPLVSVELEFTAGENSIDVEALLRR